MVWSVKYRRKILKPEIEEYLQELVQQIAEGIPIMWKQSDLYLRKISAVILNIRASRIDSRWNVNFYL